MDARRFGLAVLVALATIVSTAGAQGRIGYRTSGDTRMAPVQIGGQYYNPETGALVDANGNAIVTEAYPDRDRVLLQPSIISARFCYGADGLSTGWTSPKTVTYDSTSAVNTQGFTRLALLFYPQFEDSIAAAQFAIQTRLHSNSGVDSMSVYDVLRVRTSSTGIDTAGSFTEANAQRLVQFGSSGIDTAQIGPGEIPVLFFPNKNSHSGAALMLDLPRGTPIAGPYVSFRVRIMNTFNANLTSWTHTDGTLTGVAIYGAKQGRSNIAGGQSSGDTRFVILRADLVGWR